MWTRSRAKPVRLPAPLIALGLIASLVAGPACAAVIADRFGGFEDAECYGEGAGKAAPAAADVYEALAEESCPSGAACGTVIVEIEEHVCFFGKKAVAAGTPAPLPPPIDPEGPATVTLQAGPATITYSLRQQRTLSASGGRAGPELNAMTACDHRDQTLSGAVSLSSALPEGWYAKAYDGGGTYCTIAPGSNACSFVYRFGNLATLVAEVGGPHGWLATAVHIIGTDDGQCHDAPPA